jgi:RDD family protein
MELRQLVPLAPLPGAVLTIVVYGLDPTFGSGGYPAHQWSTFAVIAGWCLVLAGLVMVAHNLVTVWAALIAGVSFVSGPSNPGTGAMVFYGIGFFLTAVLILIVVTTYVVRRYGARGRIVAAIALGAVGVAALLSLGYPGSPYLDNPGTQVWAVLVLAPVGVAVGAAWAWLDRPPAADIADLGPPASLLRRFLGGLISWVIFGVAGATLSGAAGQLGPGVGEVISAGTYPLCVVLLQVMPTALWGRTLGQMSVGVRVIRVDGGSRPGWLRSIVRFLVFQVVPLLGFIYLVAWGVNARLGIGPTVPDRLAWDRASGTAVVRAPGTAATARPPVVTPAINNSTSGGT